MKKIAIIGTGIMGHGMSLNFLKNGYTVYVWNRSHNRLKELIKNGAIETGSPKEATENADIIFEVTADDKSSKSVWTSKQGILSGADKNKILISSATLSINWIDTLIRLCKQKGFNFFDIPLTGGRMGAESGNLILLIGGDQKKLQTFESILEAISSKIHYFGKEGSGMKYKLLLNMLQGLHMAAFGEVMHLAKELGLDENKVGDALVERPGGVITNLAWDNYKNPPKPINFSVEWITKDLKYAKKSALKTETPLLDQLLKKFKKIILKGKDQEDWSYINK